jgi:hypothetical protein
MKRIKLLFALCLTMLTIAQAQVPPNAFNYNAVARNSAGQPIATTSIGIQISILKSSPTGALQYSENHSVNTDDFGLFNVVIGTGTVQSGFIDSIDWGVDNYYLKVSMDTLGGINFLTMVTNQLVSVPYALHAKSAGNIAGNYSHYLGENYGGGIIFHLYKDVQGMEHGLIVDITDLSISQNWSNINSSMIGPSAQSTWDGLNNSIAIVNQPGHTNSAASLCLNSTNGGQSDWYLPAIDELSLLWHNCFIVNKSLSSMAGATSLPYYGGTTYKYLSSTEYVLNQIWGINSGSSIIYYFSKSSNERVRAIRAF